MPRLGFVGVGWIGAMRMRSVAERFGAGAVAAVCDPSEERRREALGEFPDAAEYDSLEAMLDEATASSGGALPGGAVDGGALDTGGLDGVVIATPNDLHAPQTLAALERGLAVFCQKPLALDAAEARQMVDAARDADRLLGVDYSYRHTDSAQAIRRLIQGGELGRVFLVDAAFHNAYGPDKAWCWDPARSGGGAFVDLGVHLLDLALWWLDFPAVEGSSGHGWRDGQRLEGRGVDDFATARLLLQDGAEVRAAASWNAPAGADCVVRIDVFGTGGGAVLENVEGSFFDFTARRRDGRTSHEIAREGGEWLGRGIVAWCERLATSPRYDPDIEHSIEVSAAVDAVYGRTT